MYQLQPRAPKGGKLGINGEFYEGGKFLPQTDKAKNQKKRKAYTGKQNIAPYKWVKSQNKYSKSIYSEIGLVCTHINNIFSLEDKTEWPQRDNICYNNKDLYAVAKSNNWDDVCEGFFKMMFDKWIDGYNFYCVDETGIEFTKD